MDYLSTTLDLLSIIVVVIVLSAIIWAMLRYYEIIEQERSVEEKKLDQETVEKYGNIWKNRLHPYSNQETVRNQNTLYPDSNPGNLLSRFEIFAFFSSPFLKTREKYISFPKLGLLSLYIS